MNGNLIKIPALFLMSIVIGGCYSEDKPQQKPVDLVKTNDLAIGNDLNMDIAIKDHSVTSLDKAIPDLSSDLPQVLCGLQSCYIGLCQSNVTGKECCVPMGTANYYCPPKKQMRACCRLQRTEYKMWTKHVLHVAIELFLREIN